MDIELYEYIFLYFMFFNFNIYHSNINETIHLNRNSEIYNNINSVEEPKRQNISETVF